MWNRGIRDAVTFIGSWGKVVGSVRDSVDIEEVAEVTPPFQDPVSAPAGGVSCCFQAFFKYLVASEQR